MKRLSSTLRTILVTLLAAFFLIAMAPCQKIPPPVDFSGKWLLNVSASQMGKVPIYAAPKQFDIKQKVSEMSIERITTNKDNVETINTETVPTDGKPHTYEMKDKRLKTNTMTWAADKQSLKTISEYKVPGDSTKNYTLTQIWTLTNEGKTLVVLLTSPTYTYTAKYDKQ